MDGEQGPSKRRKLLTRSGTFSAEDEDEMTRPLPSSAGNSTGLLGTKSYIPTPSELHNRAIAVNGQSGLERCSTDPLLDGGDQELAPQHTEALLNAPLGTDGLASSHDAEGSGQSTSSQKYRTQHRIDGLPLELWREIFWHLDAPCVGKMALSCSDWARRAWELMHSFTHGENFVLSRLLHAPQFRHRRFKNMQIVSLTRVRGFANDHTLESITIRFPNIKHLDVTWCNLLTDAGLRHVSSLTSLESLRLNGVRNFSSAELQHSLCHLTNLRELSFDFCYQVDGLFYGSLSRLTKLRTLSLECCVQLTTPSVEETFQGFTNLTSLNISGCTGLTNRVLTIISHNMPNLTQLDISYLNSISGQTVEYLVAQLTKLTLLEASGNGRSANLAPLRAAHQGDRLRIFV